MQDTRAVVGEFFRRVGAWDADGVGELFAEQIEWRVWGAPSLPWVGSRTRREEVPAFFKTMWSHFLTERSISAIDEVIVDGDDAVAFGAFSHVARTTGRGFTTPVALHFTVKNGLIVRVHLFEDTYAVAKAFEV